jgi:hypothetical protein
VKSAVRAKGIEERGLGGHAKVASHEVAGFRDDGGWHQEGSAYCSQPSCAGSVVAVSAIGEGVEHSGVNDDHDV